MRQGACFEHAHDVADALVVQVQLAVALKLGARQFQPGKGLQIGALLLYQLGALNPGQGLPGGHPLAFAQEQGVELTIAGPEDPLVNGIVDRFAAAGLACFGPSAAAAQLEGSKSFAKDFMARHGIPTAAYGKFTEVEPAIEFIRAQGAPIVVKADGLAAGKGVIIAHTTTEAEAAVIDMLAGNAFGDAGHRVVIEEFLVGEEASFIVMADGKSVLPLATSQDHKPVGDGDTGPNTGGMGAYTPAPVVTEGMHRRAMEEVIMPTIEGMAADGAPFTGFLYAGLMIMPDGTPRVIEYNCRFGDPETQPIMMRLQTDLVALCDSALAGHSDGASPGTGTKVSGSMSRSSSSASRWMRRVAGAKNSGIVNCEYSLRNTRKLVMPCAAAPLSASTQ